MDIINRDIVTLKLADHGEFSALAKDVTAYAKLSKTALAASIAGAYDGVTYQHGGETKETRFAWPVYWRTNFEQWQLAIVLAGLQHPRN